MKNKCILLTREKAIMPKKRAIKKRGKNNVEPPINIGSGKTLVRYLFLPYKAFFSIFF
jgi:hypothetical protein